MSYKIRPLRVDEGAGRRPQATGNERPRLGPSGGGNRILGRRANAARFAPPEGSPRPSPEVGNHQPELQCGSWRGSIREARDQIEDVLDDNPSLRAYPAEWLPKAYARARMKALDENWASAPARALPVDDRRDSGWRFSAVIRPRAAAEPRAERCRRKREYVRHCLLA